MDLRCATLTAAMAAVVACQSGTDQPEAVSLEVTVGAEGVAIERVFALEDFPIFLFQTPSVLRYQLVDPAGAVIVSGAVDDPRYMIGENLGEDGTLSREVRKLEAGSVALRLPAVAGELVILEPRDTGAVELGRTPFDPSLVEAPRRLAASLPRAGLGTSQHALADDDDVLGPPVTIAGDEAGFVKILVLPEAYAEADLPQFEKDADAMMEGLFASRDYRPYAQAFRIQRQNVRSRDSGIGDEDRDTAFEMKKAGDLDKCPEFSGPRSWFGLGGLKGEGKAKELARRAGADLVVLLVKGGPPAGCSGHGEVIMGNNSGRLFGHELGHAIFGLGDEYGGFGAEPLLCGIGSFFGLKSKPNVSNDPVDVPWVDLLTEGVPMPTQVDGLSLIKWEDAVGSWEGGVGCDSGYWHPQSSCMMHEVYSDMCAVCRREMERFFQAAGVDGDALAEPCRASYVGDGICDPACEDEDPDCFGRCDVDGVCYRIGGAGESCVTCPEDCGACGTSGCGDGSCGDDETDESCPADCGCAARSCEDEVAPFGCYCDPTCETQGDCCSDAAMCTASDP